MAQIQVAASVTLRRTKKEGNQQYFGTKAHIGVEAKSGRKKRVSYIREAVGIFDTAKNLLFKPFLSTKAAIGCGLVFLCSDDFDNILTQHSDFE